MSIALRTKLRSLSAAHLLSSFPSSIDGGYGQPPEPIPNRPFRNQSSYPSTPSPRISNLIRDRKIETQHSSPSETDADFLERFKLGFEPIPKTQPEDEIFKKMKETGLIPNAVAMIDSLCKDGLVQDAMKLFRLMREKGTIPGVVLYTAVVEGFCKVLIRGLCNGNRLDDACVFAIGMLEAGHYPNLGTVTRLIEGLCREKGLEDARKAFDEMRAKGYFVEEKEVIEYLHKNGPFVPSVFEAILGKKASKRSLF
ncbi:hypothetical protein CASFOL_038439 [Castilleja foliolosa]|uniref:Pentatricopeptide repeat-containing protein n=1 Tax=Castilleja foliolosa TaxID=1961234 RepID=A0ABD3BKZ8_9LAMI